MGLGGGSGGAARDGRSRICSSFPMDGQADACFQITGGEGGSAQL